MARKTKKPIKSPSLGFSSLTKTYSELASSNGHLLHSHLFGATSGFSDLSESLYI